MTDIQPDLATMTTECHFSSECSLKFKVVICGKYKNLNKITKI